jgi:uncharacterized glyoxalase superfamily protein PhnB
MDFLTRAFDARQVGEIFKSSEGKIRHAVVQIGDSMIEMGDSAEPMPMNLHIYVNDVDGIYRRALAAGAVSVREPETTFYGDRSAGVKDPGGNTWWLACHVEDVQSERCGSKAFISSRSRRCRGTTRRARSQRNQL